jgi:type III restriction enzyme
VPSKWRKPYVPLDKLAEMPYVCLRLPTGGGKTFLGARAVKVGAKFLERENNPLVLWLLPTDAIRQQRLETLHKALFLWAVKKDEHGRGVHRQLQDKLAKA